MDIPCMILNEDFTGINQNTLNKYLEVYKQLLDLIPNNFHEHIELEGIIKNTKSVNEENTPHYNITSTKFNSLTRNISNKYFGAWRQTDSESSCVRVEERTSNYMFKAEKEYNTENVLKKRFLFWIINNYENQRIPNLSTVNQDSTL
ncbi:uncharacterized protein ELE39_001396 [Cryptosporidium sp. chipmunk genotype I]|uniref:uncharacterized protein n=1 Tax=Cryptosporidium sp. chipmunk genotype I TaxID=1280935 RepID=UPI003519EEB6|nr:hypothetical protein ELE39_001396 [Cryptosporidium sp. chipmunk genotype I]